MNEGGESFPCETVAACRMPDEKGTVLIVNGFDRVSAPLSVRADSLAGFYTDIDGGVPDRQDISFIGGSTYSTRKMAKYGGRQHRFGCLRLRLRNGGDRRQH